MIDLYFGLPGSGKTTTIAALAYKALKGKKYQNVYTNVPMNLDGLRMINRDSLGILDISNGLVLYDEGGVDFDNRDYVNFNKNLTWFFKYHRHCKVDVKIFSQSIDVDKKIRSLANHVYYLYLPPLTGRWISKIVRIHYGVVFPSEKTTGSKVGDILEGYSAPSIFDKLVAARVLRGKYYRYFDSYSIDRELMPFPDELIYHATLPDPTERKKDLYDRLRDLGHNLWISWLIITGRIRMKGDLPPSLRQPFARIERLDQCGGPGDTHPEQGFTNT